MVKLAKRLVVGNARGDGWREGEGVKAFPCHAKIGQVAPGLWRQPSTVLYSMRQERIDDHYGIFKPQWQCIFSNYPGKKVPPPPPSLSTHPPTSKYLPPSLCADCNLNYLLPSTLKSFEMVFNPAKSLLLRVAGNTLRKPITRVPRVTAFPASLRTQQQQRGMASAGTKDYTVRDALNEALGALLLSKLSNRRWITCS